MKKLYDLDMDICVHKEGFNLLSKGGDMNVGGPGGGGTPVTVYYVEIYLGIRHI